MPHYLLSTYIVEGQPSRAPSSPEEMQTFMGRVADLEDEMEAAGVFVFGGGLTGPGDATVATVTGGDTVLTDGPFAEAKEQIGGFYIIDAPDDAAAHAWGSKVASAVGGPIEVRAFRATGKVRDHMTGSQGS
ncbi:MAG: YciI family protein [Acidimicrobiia bacterium]|nr:YciI family protein [Acidimicrobiia bacterium]